MVLYNLEFFPIYLISNVSQLQQEDYHAKHAVVFFLDLSNGRVTCFRADILDTTHKLTEGHCYYSLCIIYFVGISRKVVPWGLNS